jgi:hypothetical protein
MLCNVVKFMQQSKVNAMFLIFLDKFDRYGWS